MDEIEVKLSEQELTDILENLPDSKMIYERNPEEANYWNNIFYKLNRALLDLQNRRDLNG